MRGGGGGNCPLCMSVSVSVYVCACLSLVRVSCVSVCPVRVGNVRPFYHCHVNVAIFIIMEFINFVRVGDNSFLC
jgi:hypothetical protein